MSTILRNLSCLLALTLFVLIAKPAFAQGLLFAPNLSPLEELGQELFNDTDLSQPSGRQGCVSCHEQSVGFTSPDFFINFFFGPHNGAIPHRFGPRKPPTAAYAGDSGNLHYVGPPGGPHPFLPNWEGGLFWDGRATGLYPMMPGVDIEFDPLAEQALAPFLNNVEQNLNNKKALVRKVAFASYRDKFLDVFGPDSLEFQNKDTVEIAYDQVVKAIAAFERSELVNPYTSKFDYWLNGEVELTDEEKLGLWLMETPGPSFLSEPPPGGTADNKGQGQCGICHTSSMRDVGGELLPPLFTDFRYHNIGSPKNPNNPFYFMPKTINPDGSDYIDRGLAETLESYLGTTILGTTVTPAHVAVAEGKFKTPTLRNVNKRPFPQFVKAYGHNGVFKSMKEIVHFYNTRDVSDEWDTPEVPQTKAAVVVGDLGLTDEEEDAIVAFLATLTDGYDPSNGGQTLAFQFPLRLP